jgi:hypothetical protein
MLRNVHTENLYKEQNGEISFLLGNALEPTVIPPLRLQISHCSQFRIMCDIIIIIIIIIIILGIFFMQGIYTYIPETNHVPREHRVATIMM